MEKHIPSSNKQVGFSLLEVLISVVVLAVGLLGIAALQTSVIKFNHSAQLRSFAVYQAQNMIDRMRANKAGVTAGNYNSVSGTPSLPSCTTCTPAQIAQRDISLWNTENALLLPVGQGTVVGNGSVFTVTIRWDNERNGATGTACSGNTDVDLSCVIMGVQL
jgi:type IV pilus assembly protein PilV